MRKTPIPTQVAQYGTAEEAKTMLDKAVAAVKEDKAKARDMFNKGKGGFKDRDLYLYCANASDGIFTAHPTHKGEQLKNVVGKKGYPLGNHGESHRRQGKRRNLLVASPRLRQATRKAHFLHEDWRPNLRRRLLQVGSTSPASTHSSQHQVPLPSGKKPRGCAWDAQGQSLHCTVAPASHQPSRGHGDGTMAATPEGPSRSARRLVVRNFLTFGLG